jgi:hypothetical protein
MSPKGATLPRITCLPFRRRKNSWLPTVLPDLLHHCETFAIDLSFPTHPLVADRYRQHASGACSEVRPRRRHQQGPRTFPPPSSSRATAPPISKTIFKMQSATSRMLTIRTESHTHPAPRSCVAHQGSSQQAHFFRPRHRSRSGWSGPVRTPCHRIAQKLKG